MLNLKTFSSRRTSKRSAFTLIELSIVLIIIGLLVAGVTGGASLIRSAQLRSVMSEARGFNVAVNAFFVQYDELPGDYGTAIGASSFGNANGQINYIDDQANDDVTAVVEGIAAWHHLANSGTIDETLTVPATLGLSSTSNGSADAVVNGTNVPDSRLDGVGWVFDYTTINSDARNVVVATGPLAATAFTLTTTPIHFTAVGAMTTVDALSIDQKLDDGIANDGRVRVPTALDGSAGTDCANGASYTTGNSGDLCGLEFTVDIS